MKGTYRNPILPGFYPDPSICRVGEDYYLVTSSFEYFPGLPIFHSRDLVHWHQIGHVLDRPSQLPLDHIRPSGGLYAPTIRYHSGTYYVICTLVDGHDKSGNFFVTAPEPGGPWSEPHWLDDAPGIDPSLFFDEDGRAWYCGNRVRENPRYKGDSEIWLQELNLQAFQLTGPKYTLWNGALRGAGWPEAPHIYKIHGIYYLMIAEGGTGHNHAVTIARSQSLTGPYDGNPRNPILTHRHLGLDYPIVGTGHADLVETQTGEWWMVALAMRPYGGYYYNLGRESFLTPVAWEEGWPIVNRGVGKIQFEEGRPDLPEHPVPPVPPCDHFMGEQLGFQWNFIRTPREVFWSLDERKGTLRLKLRPEMLTERVNPSFIGRRQQHINFSVRTAMEFTPGSRDECAGLALCQNDGFHFRFVHSLDDNHHQKVQLVQVKAHEEKIIGEHLVNSKRLYLKVEATGQDYSFFVAEEPEKWRLVADAVDGRSLSTPVAGGFTGAYIGMYASSNGKTSQNTADFEWFEYTGL